MGDCVIPACGRTALARGWCQAHYLRWRRHGDPLAGSTTPGEPLRYFQDVVLAYEGDECLPWPYAKNDGYGCVWEDGRLHTVSRLVCERTHGPPPTPEHEAAHSCGKGHLGCVTKRHLSWKTHAENMADMPIHGTSTRGELNPVAKLTETDVRNIRALQGTMTQREIAAQFGVQRKQISRIHRRERWGHI